MTTRFFIHVAGERIVRAFAVMVAVLILVAGCGGAEPIADTTPAPPTTPVAPSTDTPLPPTDTPHSTKPPAATPTGTPFPSPPPAEGVELTRYPWTSEEVTFTNGRMTLVGDLHLPQGPGPHPAVIFVHGSGELDRNCLGFYQPLFAEFTKAGFACLSWDKPGVGESTRPQGAYDDRESFFERATEVRKAIDFLKSRGDIDLELIGLWGISRAGWIMPMVASWTDDVAFVIAVSCAGTDSIAQKAYQAQCHEAEEDCSEKEIIAALAREGTGSHLAPSPPDGVWENLEGRNPDYVSHPAMNAHQDGSPYIDARPFLEQMTCPVLAIYGQDDWDVPPFESARIYREALEKAGNPDGTVKVFSDANHFLLQTEKMDQLSSYLERGEWPWAPGYLELMSSWLVERFEP